ncbi:NADAR domain-containing protein [Frankia sp. AiPs1]|uniref:NADAR domain-containing protein n=1 Tax=Frankia sp. AiPa1 TaxID=573492 RepID=UPI00202B46B2|nr:NADAR domain-containing protein [Frankia sp. AiPa1]MCL9762864.1 NADAR domain-containing protein [Frankia sp. AiPa1]
MLPTAAPPRTVDDLCRLELTETPLRYRYFGGLSLAVSDSTGAGCLSLLWPSRFEVDGVQYRSAQHFVLARKAIVFGDEEALRSVWALPAPIPLSTPCQRVRGYDPAVWAGQRRAVAVEANLAKFGQNRALGSYLVGTTGLILANTSPRDRIWGIGCDRQDERAAHPGRWPGHNLLGFALMEVRHRLRVTRSAGLSGAA